MAVRALTETLGSMSSVLREPPGLSAYTRTGDILASAGPEALSRWAGGV